MVRSYRSHFFMPIFLRKQAQIGAVLLAVLSLGACSSLKSAGTSVSGIAQAIQPYKIDIVQGNVVTREQLAVLRPGMPKAAVQDVLGTSLLASVFHADRWDYVFTLRSQGMDPQSRRVTVFFKNGLVDHIDADELPSEADFVASLKSTPIKGPLPAMTASEQDLEKFPAPARTENATPAPVPGAAPTTYPPLEPQ
jgi:outer membrane protein assembly factor BamE